MMKWSHWVIDLLGPEHAATRSRTCRIDRYIQTPPKSRSLTLLRTLCQRIDRMMDGGGLHSNQQELHR